MISVLLHLDWTRGVVVETEPSGWVWVGVLSQKGVDRVLYPVTFHTKKYSTSEANYKIYDRELMAIV